jgi:drug/metabolite transporter (DMT)-like permease
MWSLFTTALARGTSTTQVSIMNTSTNFILTAFMGWLIFSEALPAMWWAGAALLVAGNVIIGRKDESKEGAPDQQGDGYVPVARAEGDDEPEATRKDSVDEDIIDLGDLHGERR